jgi:hypothetical protein
MLRHWSLFAFVMSASISGCSKDPEPVASPPAPAEVHATPHAEAPALSAEDQALADMQKVCIVGDGPLGSMGHPVKVMIGDRAVFLCCEHCRGPLEKDPEKYLAKLDAAAAAPADVTPEATTEAGTPATETPAAPAPEAAATPTTEAPAKPE